MSFFRRVARLSLRDRVRSWVMREEFGVEPLLLYIEMNQMKLLRHLVRMPPGRFGVPSKDLVEVAGKGFPVSRLRILPARPEYAVDNVKFYVVCVCRIMLEIKPCIALDFVEIVSQQHNRKHTEQSTHTNQIIQNLGIKGASAWYPNCLV